MKSLQLFILLLLTTGIFAQELTTDNLQIKEQLEEYKQQLLIKNRGELGVLGEYQCDTFLINRLYEATAAPSYTTRSMEEGSMEMEKNFDILLNKYYKKLRAKLDKKDRDILKKAQLSWIGYRDSERALTVMLSKEKYSGGGTIQRLLVASRFIEITQDRVEDLVEHLSNLTMP